MLSLALIDPQTFDIVKVALIVGFVILSLSIHEWAHAWTAHKFGDDTAKSMGRMTPNPIVHIDPIMTIAVPALLFLTTGFVFGGAKPVPVDPRNFKHPHAANAVVAAAGPISNAVLAFLFVLAWHVAVTVGGYETNQLLPEVLSLSALLNVLLAVFNLIPIPPLDGSRIVMWLLPKSARPGYAMLESFGILIVIALLFMTPLRSVLADTVYGAIGWIDSVVGLVLDALGL